MSASVALKFGNNLSLTQKVPLAFAKAADMKVRALA
jgi:hypothetical protein